ncbi:MAG TPA: hypothetical protein EYO33_25760 [Phycisphaerales bacterium]|nr:hypothetical protein [Phycisphaerales bacterium]
MAVVFGAFFVWGIVSGRTIRLEPSLKDGESPNSLFVTREESAAWYYGSSAGWLLGCLFFSWYAFSLFR